MFVPQREVEGSNVKSVKGYTARTQTTREVKCLKTRLKFDYFKKLSSEINFAREQRAVEKEFRLRKEFDYGAKSRATYVTPEQFADHFRDHFNSDSKLDVELSPEIASPERFPELQSTILEVSQDPPTREKLKAILSSLNNGRSWGVDLMTMAILKYNTGDKFLDVIVELFASIWSELTVPAEWATSWIVTLFNKGARSLPSNYRGLSIISNLTRLLPMIILRRLQSV